MNLGKPISNSVRYSIDDSLSNSLIDSVNESPNNLIRILIFNIVWDNVRNDTTHSVILNHIICN